MTKTETTSDDLKKETEAKADADSVVPERAAWGSPVEFVLSCLNYAVGLGNVWRFPYLVYRNGGGAFLIPYIIMLFTMGLPIFYLELIVGQYSGVGPNTAFMRMAPIFHGLGYCALAVITMITIYYQVIVAWTIFYTYESFAPELAWGKCDHDYNTEFCFSQMGNMKCQESVNPDDSSTFVTFYNNTCRKVQEICETEGLIVASQVECKDAVTGNITNIRFLVKRVLSSEEYYNDYAMGINGSSWEDWGILRWEMVVCLFIAWVVCYLCVIKGVSSMGKVVYFTSVFPYFVLTALLIRGATLPGAYEGIVYYITPQWEFLLNASVWGDAASQTFYALGIGCGSLVTLASYNKFENNCHRDALFVGLVNMFTSVYAGFAIFAILGFLAHELGVPVNEVVQDGPGLAFIAYPEAVNMMPLPQLWAVFFFLMLFILGLGSQFGGVEAICTAIIDHWPWLRKWNFLVTASVCTACFLLALPMCCSGGVFLFTLMDWNTASWSILFIGFLELALCSWVFGMGKFLELIKEMKMDLPAFALRYWWLMWIAISEIFLVGIIIFTFIDYTPASYGAIKFPHWVDALGWLIASASLVPLPVLGAYQLFKNHKRQGDWRLLFKPKANWGPQSSKPLLASLSPSTAALQMYDNVSFLNEDIDEIKKRASESNATYDNNAFKNDEMIDDIFKQVNNDY